jgi:hypothetical protein
MGWAREKNNGFALSVEKIVVEYSALNFKERKTATKKAASSRSGFKSSSLLMSDR